MRIPYYRSKPGDHAGGLGGPVPGVIVIAATYFYFLLFGEFALLHLLESRAGDPGFALRGLLWLAGGGVTGSLGAALLYRGHALRQGIVGGFTLCAVAAALAAVNLPNLPLHFVAGLAGLGLGLLTVTVASGLHRIFSSHTLGLWTALGTGLAYAACNVPAIFRAAPPLQAGLAAGACLLGIAAGSFVSTDLPPGGAARAQIVGRPLTFWALLGAFVVLVAFDSAAFLLIQERSPLRAASWGSDAQLWSNAAVHLVAALLAGWLLERGMIRTLLALAGADLVLASADLAGHLPTGGALHHFYPAGVSLYSAALVALPALSRRWPAAPVGAWRAAWLYIFAGWLGSAAGIGFARNLPTIPFGGIVAAGVALGLCVLAARMRRGAAAGAVLAGLLLAPKPAPAAPAPAADPVAAGRRVYVAEGCIHCHSQFVRPGTADVLWWGPERPLTETLAGAPPLPGNRRQGPDLQNVGNRRSADWNRAHLQRPRALAPGSVMPSYAHLFAADDARGEALVAFLSSLGAETAAARARTIAAWRFERPAAPDAARGARLFAGLCAACHGADGRGRGPLAAQLATPPADLVAGPRPRTGTVANAGREAQIARVIKFGVPGTAMAGHETLPAADLAALAAHVAALPEFLPAP